MEADRLGTYLLILMVAMTVSMAVIPLMMKYAHVLGMIDKPDPRKVHATPIPRVGGVGIVVGALLAMWVWLPASDLLHAFLLGCAVLFVFGVWDDIKELGHYVKFIGQFAAAIAVVYYGDLYVWHFPYIESGELPAWFGKPFTVIAIVGVINALNHSDGLDGLAGGEALLSLGALAYFLYLFGGTEALVIACATLGGIFGFLRFNSHPARVFMGDGGSQFIGFVIAVLVVMLTQQVNPVLSPALPLLLIGLPVVDILAVFFLRWKGGMNLFRATSNHIHHRLLKLGFRHHESVVIIYSVQALMVLLAVAMPYENDYAITFAYLAISASVFIGITALERKQLALRAVGAEVLESWSQRLSFVGDTRKVYDASLYVMEACLGVLLFAAALLTESVPWDIGMSSLLMLLVLALLLKWENLLVYRLLTFVALAFSVYLLANYAPQWVQRDQHLVYLFFALLAAATFLVARKLSGDRFSATPLDYLVLGLALILAFSVEMDGGNGILVWMALQMVLLFYAAELSIQRAARVRSKLSGMVAAALLIAALRGVL